VADPGGGFVEYKCSFSLFQRSPLAPACHYCIQRSAVADKPARRAASRRTCCKQISWTLSVINLRPN